MTTIKKLAKMPYAQAHVEIDDENNITLFSYITRVAEIDADGWVTIFELHTMTTRKHIGAFLAEYVTFPNGEHGVYQDFKKLYDDGYSMNIETGEIRKI